MMPFEQGLSGHGKLNINDKAFLTYHLTQFFATQPFDSLHYHQLSLGHLSSPFSNWYENCCRRLLRFEFRLIAAFFIALRDVMQFEVVAMIAVFVVLFSFVILQSIMTVFNLGIKSRTLV